MRNSHSRKDVVVCLGLLIVCAFFGCIDRSHAADKIKGMFVVPDVLGFPGKPVMLKVRLVRAGILSHIGLGGEKVVFTVGKKAVGTALTGGDGRAFLEYTRHMRGNEEVVVSLEKSPRVESTDGEGVVAIWERRRPILLVDLVALMPEGKSPTFSLPNLPLNLGDNLQDPIPEASKELQKLTQFYYNLVYLYRHEGEAFQAAREWVRAHEFPLGLTRAIKPGPTALKTFIDQLKEGGWDNLDAGIGRTPDFAKVLVKDRIHAVILQESDEDEEFPRRTKFVKNWKEVRKHL